MGIASALACATQYSHSDAFRVIDARGREIEFQAPPQRIVVAGQAFFMAADAVLLFPEAGSRLVALPSSAGIHQRGGDLGALLVPDWNERAILSAHAGVEEIAALRPDVVILKSISNRLGDSLTRIGIPIVYVDLEAIETYPRDLGILGAVLGNPGRATELAASYADVLERVRVPLERLAESDKPRVLLLRYEARGDTRVLRVPPSSWIQADLVEQAGGIALWRDVPDAGGWTAISFEQIAAWNPDVVIVVDYANDPRQAAERLRADPRWRALRCARSGRIHAMPGDFRGWDQPDPRWRLGLIWLATRLHPERFATLGPRDELDAFYALYGLDPDDVRRAIVPHLQGDFP